MLLSKNEQDHYLNAKDAECSQHEPKHNDVDFWYVHAIPYSFIAA